MAMFTGPRCMRDAVNLGLATARPRPRRMQTLILALLIAGPVLADADRLELSASGGWSWPSGEITGGYGHPSAPFAAIRVGYQVARFVTIGVRAEGVLGAEHAVGYSGNRAYAVLAEVQLHTTGRWQLTAAGGVGVGTITRLAGSDSEYGELRGSRLPVVELALGTRVFATPWIFFLVDVRLTDWLGAQRYYFETGREQSDSPVISPSIGAGVTF